MRKSRKGPQPSAAGPDPKPKAVETDPTKQNRPCLFCHRAVVKFLDMTHTLDEGSYFCCVQCAAAAAITEEGKSRRSWCAIHSDWTDRKGKCPRCDSQKNGYASRLDDPREAEGGAA